MKFAKHMVFSALLLIAGICAMPPAALANPTAVLPELHHDFGTVPDIGTYSYTFTIQNTGDKDLVIDRIATDCGCATTEYDKIIAPQQQGKITVVFNAKGYKGFNITRNIKVYTNDPENNSIHLTISAIVVASAEISPQRMSFTGVVGEQLSGTVTITPSDNFPMKILSAEARSGYNIRFELKENLNGDKPVYSVTVYNTKETAGKYADEIIMQTDNKDIPEISFRVYGTILPAGN